MPEEDNSNKPKELPFSFFAPYYAFVIVGILSALVLANKPNHEIAIGVACFFVGVAIIGLGLQIRKDAPNDR